MKKFLLFAFIALLANAVIAQIPYLLIYDKYQSAQFGASNLISLNHLSYKYLGGVLPYKLWDETKIVNKIGGIGYRAIRLGATGFQMDVNTVLYQHEVFGHGSRCREFNYQDRKYTIRPIFPFYFGGRAGGRSSYPISITQSLMISSGGVEADLVLSEQLEERILSSGLLHYRQSLLFLISRNNILRYAFRDISNQGDISGYVSKLNLSRNNNPNSITVRDVFNQTLAVLLNPLQWYSILNLSKDYLINGDSGPKQIRFIKFKDVGYLPSINYNLTPFGGEFIISNHFLRNRQFLILKARISEGTFTKFFGGGVKLLNFVNSDQVKTSAIFDFWNQPGYNVGTPSGPESIDGGFGYMLKASCSYFPIKTVSRVGLYGQFGGTTTNLVDRIEIRD